ncbi:hypothetical protein DFH09DRAFT_1314747 [Mycena vulgaris]|nr:hypothetical protein DFH09DRAFT_1314747 [Mycena vulgaris]
MSVWPLQSLPQLLDDAGYTGVKISGDLFACDLCISHTDLLLLVNWHTSQFIAFHGVNVEFHLALVPGHVIIVQSRSNTSPADQVRIHSLPSLNDLWRPLSDLADHEFADPIDIASITVDIPGNNLSSPPHFHYASISLAPSLLHDEAYELVVQVEDEVGSPTQESMRTMEPPNPPSNLLLSTVSRYHLVFSPVTPRAPQLRSLFRYRKEFNSNQMSGAGFSLSFKFTWESAPVWVGIEVHAVDETGIHTRQLLPMWDVDHACDVQMARTGAIMVQDASRIVVSHYI